MAESVKVQGSVERCLETLKYYAEKYQVNYQASFPGKSYTVTPHSGESKKTVLLFFNWRYEYKEYDNSV